MPQARITDLAQPDTGTARFAGLPGRAPKRSDLADYPASWYLLCPTQDLQQGPTSIRALGRDLVAFKTESGRIAVMNARCSHMGADLAKGKVVGEAIQCPFHGWRYGCDGRCSHIPGMPEIPARARQNVYPTVERFGMIFFFNGPDALFPLSSVFEEMPANLVAARPVEFLADCTWFMVAAHGFDGQHFATVHSRKLHAPLAVDCPSPFARRSRYTADVLGHAYYDRLLRRFAGNTVTVSITTWGGTIVVITARFARATSRFAICLSPMEGGKTQCRVIPFARRAATLPGRLLVQPLDLWVRRLFTGAYLIDETESLGSPRYNPSSFVAADADMVDYFRWVAELPRPTYAAENRTTR